MQLYMRHLFYNALTRNSSDKVLKLVRKLHWEDPAVSLVLPFLLPLDCTADDTERGTDGQEAA